MAPEIRELDETTRDRIAAGEVVERPASVVKELLENALDADASRVEVRVEAGGKDRVVVADDGFGMSETEARKAVREHTTSKLRDIDDLDAIGTLGFRGEALHAIGSVACLTIRTKPRGGSRGTELVVDGGDVIECGPVGCPEGTTVEVTDLFGNVPARRKYLKTAATEFDHIQQVVAGYALANPDVAVTLEHDGRETFATPGDSDRRNAVLSVYGREVAASMIPVGDARADGDAETAAGPLAGVEGLVSHPETNRASREYMTTLVNGRYVTANVVREAVVDAYGTQLAPDRYPFAVVDIDVPAGGVDVNVHPRKLEVLFADDEGVRETVSEAIEAALLEEGLLRSRAPRGRSAPEQTEISPDTGEDEDPELTESGHRARPETGAGSNPTDASRGTGRTDETSRRDDPSPAWGDADSSRSDEENVGENTTSQSVGSTPESDREDRFRESPDQRTFDGEETTGTPEEMDRLPEMRVLGQFDGTYIVAEIDGRESSGARRPSSDRRSDGGLVLVDQHAADERVNYERLQERFADDVTTQALADPVELDLTAREAALLGDYKEALARLGFRVQRTGDRTAAVTTVPALVAERIGDEAPELARDLLAEFVDGDPEGTVESVVDDLLGDLACHPSIKGNTSLREGTVAGLLSALDDCENPYACPHGRPTIIELSREEIQDRFERDYPGHGG
ncbi:DNA mismatch repair endonuclease MutL [Natronomonas amylolytica]|uniref:DNA mismatch repair endonuclease MutL n=1 Tax=Natronomonas amylolytica TaxID=3108498 RepID=UPI003009AC82